ncbi:mucin-16-like isoform X2 [Crotalus tigris]|uniref:mucin-16-like isoform X2 n=1 Tax=Crotalus tigris TaxID=88082 RepID=UPI00192F8B8D|nr:mucin-16-like isoform X2 [Crotalus tigris]
MAVSPTSKPPMATECFTVNFIATNMIYRPQMANPTSRLFNSTQRVISKLLGQILNTNNIGPELINCSISTLRSVNQRKYTGIDSVCCYRKVAAAPPFDPINIYQKFINETNHFTKMGRYNLDPNSLFVNAVSPTSKPPMAMECFTVNFIATNVIYWPQIDNPISRLFNSQQRVISKLLGQILNTNNIGPELINCSISTLRPVNQGEYTGVDSVCCYRKAATTPPFDPINIYQKFVNETNHFTKMGRYNLDPNSLFVNAVSPTSKPPMATECFTVNFIATNMIYTPQMANPTSMIFSSTQQLVVNSLSQILNTSNIGPELINCSLSTLRFVNQGKNTGVDSVCCYGKTATAPPFNRMNIYRKFIYETNGFTKMERYSLDPNSLFVNDYHEASPATTLSPTSRPPGATECFTVNFIATNLIYRPQMANPTSRLFSSTQRFLINLLGDILKNSDIGRDLINCRLSTLRPVNQGEYTGVDSVCCYRKVAAAPPFDPINIYQKFVNETNHFTKMGRYNLDPNSLFVNAVSPTSKPPMATECFTVNFIATNMIYRPQMANPTSRLFNSTQRVISKLLGQILNTNNIGPELINCSISTLRLVNQGEYTGVDSVCCYRKVATAPPFDPINIYQKFVNETNHFTKMGRYNLDPNSLFVNGKKH